MAKLSEMILGETARNLDLIDRPATLLRRGEENRQQDLAAESNLKTAKQNRTIKTRVDARAEEKLDSDLATDDQNRKIRTQQEARDAALHPGEVDIQSEELKALGNERFLKEQEIAQKYVAPVVPQMIELNKQYLETGDNDFKVQRDKLLDQFASNQAMKAYIGMTPQFHELSGLNKMHLYSTDQTPDEKEQEIQSLLLGLGKSDQVYKTWQQEQATKSAAFVLSQQVKSTRQLTAAKGYGETDVLLDRDERFNEAGIETPAEPLSASELRDIRSTKGDDILRSMGGLGMKAEDLAKLGLDRTTFSSMNHDVLMGESRVFDAAKRSVKGGVQEVFGMKLDFSDKTKAHASMKIIRDNAATLQDATGVNVLSNDSPIMIAMEQMSMKYSSGWGLGRKSTQQRANKSPVFKGNFGSGN